ncbi:MAG: HPr(Ser) kinase/phosphatase [Candidatus Delongbacteria bacterium]|nr:HPr(Ser) kinase/phosphatase [Candidatus Delongbacteria bacterium]
MDGITVETFFRENQGECSLLLLNSDAGLKRDITQRNLHRPGLALAGFVELFTYDRIQVLGNTEIRYLESLESSQRYESLEKLFKFPIPCLIVTSDNQVPPELLRLADTSGVCIFATPMETTGMSQRVAAWLAGRFAPTTSMHGTLVDVYGTGLLLTGKSSIGKSEIALDLVERGHRLVADDLVILRRTGDNVLIGSSKEMFHQFMEIRGVGFIDVRQLFGIRAIRLQKRVEVQIKLVEWDERQHRDRTGLDRHSTSVLDVELPLIELPVFPGKNITVICETIALNLHLNVYGYDAAQQVDEILRKSLENKRISRYLNNDTE